MRDDVKTKQNKKKKEEEKKKKGRLARAAIQKKKKSLRNLSATPGENSQYLRRLFIGGARIGPQTRLFAESHFECVNWF